MFRGHWEEQAGLFLGRVKNSGTQNRLPGPAKKLGERNTSGLELPVPLLGGYVSGKNKDCV